MMRGAVTLVPSSGYCIDPKTLKQNFALLARCDTLGGTNGALDAPLGVMTVSIAATQGTPLTLESVAPVITKRVDADGFAAAKATTDTPAAGLAKSHWRAVTTLNAHDLSIALFAPAGSAALGDEGLRMIAGLIANSQSASVATSVATDLQPKVTPAKKGLAATFAGLFK